MEEKLKVVIRCLVYNHEPYLRDCLEGFVMQKTNFPFKAVVHDDCSTDGSAAIIREYAEKYPHIIEPIYETENQYSKRDGSLGRVMDAATLGRSPYIAYCEGDDYWIDSLKLQKQVDYMDAHPECSMTCSNAEVKTSGGTMSISEKICLNWFHHEKSGIILPTDILNNSGYTCTLMVRSNIYNGYPDECKRCVWGDYAIKLYASLKGSVYNFAEDMAVYRYQSIGSFTSTYSLKSVVSKSRIQRSIIRMLDVLKQFDNNKWKWAFKDKIYEILSQSCNKKFTFKFMLYAMTRMMCMHPIKTLRFLLSICIRKVFRLK